MTQTNTLLIVLLLSLLLIPLAIYASGRRDRNKREEWQAIEAGQRRRNVAHYRAWQWLYGKPKPKRLADLRKTGAKGAAGGKP